MDLAGAAVGNPRANAASASLVAAIKAVLLVPPLQSPASGAQIPPNVSATGCPANAATGYGFEVSFDWSNVPGAIGYDLEVKRHAPVYPALSTATETSSYHWVTCQGFIARNNLSDWEWRVRAVFPSGTSPWSAPRALEFLPCVLPGGGDCYAPVPAASSAR